MPWSRNPWFYLKFMNSHVIVSMAYKFIIDTVAVRKTDGILWQVAPKMALNDPCLLLCS